MGRALLVLDSPSDRQKASHWIAKAPAGTRVEFKASKRSLPQNDLMWALLTDFAQQFKPDGKSYEPSQWKAIFLHAFGREITFLPSLDGKTFLPIEMSSSDLSKQEMTDFIEFILKEAADRGIVLHNPKEHESGSPSLQPDASEQSPAALAEPADVALQSAGSTLSQKEIRLHMIDFARKALKTADDIVPVRTRHELIELMHANYRDVLPESEWGKLSTIWVSIQGVLAGKRTVDQARRFFAVDLLDCLEVVLGGANANQS